MAQSNQQTLAAVPTARTNLPLQLTSFVGREREIAELRQLLGDVRLLTLTGTGGVGKTRLALKLASGEIEATADGVWLVELAPLKDPPLVSQAVAAALDLRQRPAEPLHVTLREALRHRELLLVLDNCEHLAAACAVLVSDLLRSCPHLRILATGRERLGVVGETTWRVPSLSLPEPGMTFGADEIAACEAVRLFLDRCRLVVPGFALTDHNAANIAEICRRLDGIPLAIELAAARLNALGVQQILARLDDRLRFLKMESPGIPQRQRTLRATVEWSHDLLSLPERVLFRRLSVFAGGWSLEAAEAVCSGDALNRDYVLDLLARLVDRSLVLVEGQQAVARYGLLETLRQYAHEKLLEANEEVLVRDRHLTWCLALAEEAAPKLTASDQTLWLQVVEREQDNLRAALVWSLEGGSLELGLRLAVACGYFWEIRGHRYRAEALRWLEQAVSHAHAQTAAAALRAQALYWAGTYASELFRFERATPLLEASFALWQELDDTHGMAEALLSLGVAARVRGDYERAAAVLDEALLLMRARGDELDIAQVQRQRGRLALDSGRLDEAERSSAEALRIFERMGELHQVGHVHSELGETAREQGAFERAAALYEKGSALLSQAGCEEGVTTTRYYLACLARDRGETEHARALGLDALRGRKQAGIQRETAACLELLASLAVIDDPKRSITLYAAAENLRTTIGVPLRGVDAGRRTRTLAAVRGRVSERASAEAWNKGYAMTADEAIRCALIAPGDQNPPAAARTATGLTERECGVAALIGCGFSNRQIADELVIAERTAEAHVTHILNKLGMHSRAQVAVWAVEHGLTKEQSG